MPSLEELLRRWSASASSTTETAERIRAYEQTREQPAGLRWQVCWRWPSAEFCWLPASSCLSPREWDQLSPWSRFFLVLGMVVVIHGAAILVREPFEKLAITLHGVGTMAAGAAIFLVGQIFNLQEHWPAGVLLWSLCAIAGWVLLADQVQQTIAMLLIPAWILCDWWVRTDGYRGDTLFLVRMLASFAALYLTAFVGTKKRLVFSLLFAAAAIALTIAVVLLSQDLNHWYGWATTPAVPLHLAIVGWCWIVVVPLLVAWRLKPSAILTVAVVIVSGIVLPHLFHEGTPPYRLSAEQSAQLRLGWTAGLLLYLVGSRRAQPGGHQLRHLLLRRYGALVLFLQRDG